MSVRLSKKNVYKIVKTIVMLEGFYLLHNYYTNKILMKDRMIHKQNAIIQTYGKWINKFQKNRTIITYFIENNYHSIAIYGLGRLGKQLYEELLDSEVNVAYGIDRSISQYDKILCYNLNEELPYADLIVVTVVDEMDDIVSELSQKVSYPIQSINDILFMI